MNHPRTAHALELANAARCRREAAAMTAQGFTSAASLYRTQARISIANAARITRAAHEERHP